MACISMCPECLSLDERAEEPAKQTKQELKQHLTQQQNDIIASSTTLQVEELIGQAHFS